MALDKTVHESSWCKLRVLQEPLLEFRFGQRVFDPRDGLSLFGPFDTDRPGKPANVSYGLISTSFGYTRFLEFSKCLNASVISEATVKNPRLWPVYPGFEIAFQCKFPATPTRSYSLEENSLTQSSRINDPNKRAFDVVGHYIKGIGDLKTKSDEKLDLVICIVPEEIWKNCRSKSQVVAPIGEEVSLEKRKHRAERQSE